MCQLLGMNTNVPTDIRFSFAGFRQRGGQTDHHKDGFGIVFFEKSQSGATAGLRQFHDDKPSYCSPVADLINAYPIKAMNVICHIRKATQGVTCLANTHPFVREVWGEEWAFAHNGQLHHGFIMQLPNAPVCYQPVGTTDSELAFCYLLNRLKAEFNKPPTDSELFNFLTKLCRELSNLGLFNCLISNGDWQLAYAGSLLFYITRKAPFGEARLADSDLSVDFSEVTCETDKATLITTIPLTCNENWQQLYVDECIIFRDGDIFCRDTPENPKRLTIEEGIAIARKVGATL